MADIQRTGIPEHSMAKTYFSKPDYADSYRMRLPDNCYAGIDEVNQKLFSAGPDWGDVLMKIRDAIVGPFGLKTMKDLHPEKEAGTREKAGLFPVIKKTMNEVLMGEEDKHLSFCLSIYLEDDGNARYVTATTIVKYNNWFGRFYFIFVRPVHQLLVPSTMRRNYKNL